MKIPKPRSPLVFKDVCQLEQICSACNGTGEPRVKAFGVCGVCHGAGCELNEEGNTICELIISHLTFSNYSLHKK